MKDFAILSCMLVLTVGGLTFACLMAAADSDEKSTESLAPEASMLDSRG